MPQPCTVGPGNTHRISSRLARRTRCPSADIPDVDNESEADPAIAADVKNDYTHA